MGPRKLETRGRLEGTWGSDGEERAEEASSEEVATSWEYNASGPMSAVLRS